MLLPRRAWEIVAFPYIWGDIFRTLPFDYDVDSKSLKLTKSRTKMIVLVLSSTFLIGIEYLLLSRLLERWDTEAFQKNSNLRFHSLLLTIANLAFLQYQLCFILIYRDVPHVWNTFKDHVQKFQGKFERSDRHNGPKASREWLVGVVEVNIYAIHVTLFIQTVYIGANPDHVAYIDLSILRNWLGLGSLQWGRVSIDGVICTMIFGMLWDIVAISQGYFWGLGILPMPYILEIVVTELSQVHTDDSTRYRTRPELRLPGPFYRISREVILLAKLLQGVASPMLVVLPINLIFAMVLSGEQAIKGDNPVSRLVQLFNFAQLSLIFFYLNRLAGTFSHIFAKNIQDFLNQCRDPDWMRRVKALQVPVFRIYGMYTLGNSMIIDGFQTVLDNIVSCLSLK